MEYIKKREDMNTVRKGWLIKCRHQYPKDPCIALLYMYQSQPIMELVGLSSMYSNNKINKDQSSPVYHFKKNW